MVAVLLAVDDRDGPPVGSGESDGLGEQADDGPDVEELADPTNPTAIPSLLMEIIEGDRDLRGRFVAFAGEDTGKGVKGYRPEVDRPFV